MKTIIKSLFEYHEFTSLELEFGILYSKKEETNIKSYWLIVEVDELDNVLSNQDEWFDKCKEKITDMDFDKNTYLLVLSKRKHFAIQKNEILHIEEDPFQFKKQVLLYTEETVQNLKLNCDITDPKTILELISSETVFNAYKANFLTYNWENLLYHIAHKLPFLNINIDTNQNLGNLVIKNNKELFAKGYQDYYDYVSLNFTDEIMGALEKKGLDEIIQLLNES
jgi:hypothetical protein